MRTASTFVATERAAQTAWFARHLADEPRMDGYPYRLAADGPGANLAPSIRDQALAHFSDNGIAWHRHANHALSSQVACLNLLMPLAERPDLLARLVRGVLGGSLPEMQPMTAGPDGRPWFVDFEWIGGDHLNEANAMGSRTRGANVTSADAAMRFRQDGVETLLLVEWKYTERYGQPLASAERDGPAGTRIGGNATRTWRYRGLAFPGSPKGGPIRSDLGLSLGDFFHEPFYQLLRQQMLAWHTEKSGEVARARVLQSPPPATPPSTR